MMTWLAHHARSVGASLVRLGRTPLGTLLNMLVIGIALSLPVGLYVLIENIQASSRQLAAQPQLTAFMALDASRAEVSAIDGRLKQHARVQRYHFVSRDQALRELKQSSGLDDVIDNLPQNPLPDSFVIDAKEAAPQALDALRDEIKQWPRVALVQLDSAWARRLDAVLRMGRLAASILGTLLAIALVTITFNTIRLQVLTQRDEIEAVQLIGATDAFIRRPFLYFGALQGCGGGAIALLIVSGSVWLLNRNLGELSHLYASLFQLRYLTPGDALSLLLFPAALGWFGAWLSVGRHLARLRS